MPLGLCLFFFNLGWHGEGGVKICLRDVYHLACQGNQLVLSASVLTNNRTRLPAGGLADIISAYQSLSDCIRDIPNQDHSRTVNFIPQKNISFPIKAMLYTKIIN